jgi:uncharacterized membrane protein
MLKKNRKANGMRTIIASALTAAAVAAVFAVPGWGSAASAHRPRHAAGVCVAYGTLPLVDKDIHFAASIYTPGPKGCAKGDTFVPVGRGRTRR